MLSRSTYAKLTHHHLLAVCALAIGAVAAVPNDADVDDDASSEADASTPATDASSPADAATADATVSVALDGGSEDAGAPADSGAAAADAEVGDAGSQYVTPDGALPPYDAGDVFALLCVANPNEVDFAYASLPAPYADNDTAACEAFNPLDAGHASARACLCQNCFELQRQCDAVPGCQAIQKCAEDTGCNNADSCYLIGGACTTVINQWGNGSVATGLSSMLMTCAANANPACTL
jgi:hypothetical protein